MRLRALSSAGQGRVDAEINLADGRVVSALFTTASADGIEVASPDRDLFSMEAMSAEETRRIVSAVLAFDRAAL